ncbi:SLAP domain-containing protein [Lactobacillus sp. LL6]|uniref:SLAP domain-containing protein n=1 Tax=Lactobacillus sp. LL6 TaxID=2596827 RepID=UPI001185C252|nr:SLAP domain-containing protein [Lactobacillus sp. LL6]TSO26146.1 hypothetical protein FOD82_03490 [Lactobacillus sp. LL6]
MNKKVLISLAGVALISTSLATIAVESGNPVDAAKTSLVKGKTKKLARNAYIYNSKGKHIKKHSLKKGKKIKILGFKTIKGKKYVQTGKNEYVVAANFTPKKAMSKPKKNTKKNISSAIDPASYKNEAEYKKYMNWIESNGYIVAKKATDTIIPFNSYKGDIDRIPENDYEIGEIYKGTRLVDPEGVFKGSKGNYYIKSCDSVDPTLTGYFLAKDFEFKPANYESSTSKVDLRNDLQLKKYNDELIKRGKEDDTNLYIVVNQRTSIYKNTLDPEKTPDIKLSEIDNVDKDTWIDGTTQVDGDDYTKVIKYNGEYYYDFSSGYIKVSDTTLLPENKLNERYPDDMPNSYLVEYDD